jgi:hypothetical protein
MLASIAVVCWWNDILTPWHAIQENESQARISACCSGDESQASSLKMRWSSNHHPERDEQCSSAIIRVT